MGKPLLTDDIIERANHGERFRDDAYLKDVDETKIISTSPRQKDSFYREQATPTQRKLFNRLKNHKKKEQHIYKSRRIENAKRGEFQRKLNLAMLAIFILLGLLFFAVFNW